MIDFSFSRWRCRCMMHTEMSTLARTPFCVPFPEQESGFHDRRRALPGARDRSQHGLVQLYGSAVAEVTPRAGSGTATLLDSPGSAMGRREGPQTFSYPTYKLIRDNNDVFSGVLARAPFNVSVTWKNVTELANGEMVSGNYFDVLGLVPHPADCLVPMTTVSRAKAA